MASTDKMAAFDRQHQIAHGRHVAGDHVHVDAEAGAQHAARLANAADGVERVADRQRMQHGAPVAHRMAARRRQHAADVAVGNGAAGEFNIGDKTFAAEPAAGERHHHGFELNLGHVLGDIDGLAHRLLDLDQVDHAAGFHAARRGVGEAQNAHTVRAPAQHVLRRLRLEPRDEAGDLAGADVETRQRRRRGAAKPASSWA